MKMRRLFRHWIASVLLLLMSCSCPPNPGAEFVSQVADWRPQDYVDSLGITSVRYEDGQFVLEADLVGRDPERASGEVLIDFVYFPGLEGSVPLDFSSSTVTATFTVPEGFPLNEHAPNGAQVFVKDDQWRSRYGAWHNITRVGRQSARLQLDQSDSGTITPGFDRSRIRILGVKFGINEQSGARFEGTLNIESVTVEPPLILAPAPDLPAQAPRPVLNPSDYVELRSDGFYLNGQPWFIVGANWRLLEYGQNFGATAWFPLGNGISRHPNFIRTNLEYAVRAGVKVLRVGLLDDGRAMLDAEAQVTGYSDIFRADVQTLLDIARDAGCRVEFTLVDYLSAGKPEEVGGVLLRGRGQLFRDEATLNAFMDDFLVPFLREFGAHPALFGFDIINEPEWIISTQEGGGWEDVDDPVTRDDEPGPAAVLESFVNACAAAIRREAPGRLVTLGTSCKFARLVQDLDIDYLALHHYPWMGKLGECPTEIPAGKPWSLEEFPTRSAEMNLKQYLDAAVAAGAAGACLWNLSPAIDEFTFTHEERNQTLVELRNWVDANAGVIYVKTMVPATRAKPI